MCEVDSERSRLRAVLVNSGKFDFVEAEEKIARSKAAVLISEETAQTPSGQAAFLTAVVTGVKCFGHLLMGGAIHVPLLLPLPVEATTLAEAGTAWGARVADSQGDCWQVLIGPGLERIPGWKVRAFWDGWVAGTAPGAKAVPLGRSDWALAGVAAGALAVGQAFLAEAGDVRAGKMVQVESLWEPGGYEWPVTGIGPNQDEIFLPKDLWLIGLGNLGQAYLWSLTFLPFLRPQDVTLFIQDFDRIRRENWGTSVLVREKKYGMLKTRLAEDWALRRGFKAHRIDRKLDENLHVEPGEPKIALTGLDKLPARRALDGPGFEFIIDGGLGRTSEEYRKFRVNVFNGSFSPSVHFENQLDLTEETTRRNLQLPAYQTLAAANKDAGCGATILAGVSAAVPFVGVFTGALAVAQAIRIASGQAHHVSIVGETGNSRSTRGTLGAMPLRPTVGGLRCSS